MTSLEAIDLTIGYPTRKGTGKIVHTNLNIALGSGGLTCLLGLNGTGKSTLIKTVCGLIKPIDGTIKINGQDACHLKSGLLSKTIGVVLTDKTNAGGLSVYDLVSLGRYPYSGYFGALTDGDHEIINYALKAVGIDHKADSYVNELSDGERQKAFIAKVLAQECPIIILDEPTSFLDIASRIDILYLLKNIAKSQDKAILLSTHDLDTAIRLADTLWLLPVAKDENVIKGTPKDLICNGNLEKMFNFEADFEKSQIIRNIIDKI